MRSVLLLRLRDELPDTGPGPHQLGVATVSRCRIAGRGKPHKSSSSFESAVIDLSSVTGTGPLGVAFFSPPPIAAIVPPTAVRIVPMALGRGVNDLACIVDRGRHVRRRERGRTGGRMEGLTGIRSTESR